ncbi:MAG: hypothetical protein ACLGHS_12920, partial [Actinomycetes bacterium]
SHGRITKHTVTGTQHNSSVNIRIRSNHSIGNRLSHHRSVHVRLRSDSRVSRTNLSDNICNNVNTGFFSICCAGAENKNAPGQQEYPDSPSYARMHDSFLQIELKVVSKHHKDQLLPEKGQHGPDQSGVEPGS